MKSSSENIGYIVTLTLVPDRDFAITAWSGSFAVKIIYDIFHRRGVDFEKKARKPFIAYPLIDYGGNYIITGVVKKKENLIVHDKKYGTRVIKQGEPFKVKILLLSEELFQEFTKAVIEETTLKEPAAQLNIISVSINEAWLPDTSSLADDYIFSHLIKLKVRFQTPTCFMYRGNDICYPSPVRFILSALKTLSELTGIDTQQIVAKLHALIELMAPRIRITRNESKVKVLSDYRRILVDIGEGRLQPAFTGTSIYLLNPRPLTREQLKTVLTAIKLAEITGVGISRTIGFGKIRIESMIPVKC